MPRSHRPPSYRLHKARNSSVVTIDGRNHYLGPYGSPESHEKYARLITEWRLHSEHLLPTTGPARTSLTLSVNELILAYFRHVQGYYVLRKAGRRASRTTSVRPCDSSASCTGPPRLGSSGRWPWPMSARP
jgi:hypothetical protein